MYLDTIQRELKTFTVIREANFTSSFSPFAGNSSWTVVRKRGSTVLAYVQTSLVIEIE